MKINSYLWVTLLPWSLLAGSNAQAAADGPTTGGIELAPVQVKAHREVEGAASGGYQTSTDAVGPLGQLSFLDTPYSLNVTSGELIENTESHSMADALKTNPGVFVGQSQLTDARGMNDAFIRGFKVSYLRDGLYTNSYNMPLVEGVERMEVLNGPSAFLYGYVNPGGVINYVTKKAGPVPVASFRTGTYGGGQAFAAGDVGGPLAGTGDRLDYRVNAFYSDGGTFVDQQKLTSNMLSACMAWHITPDLVLSPHFYHSEFRQQGAQAQFLLASGVAAPATPDPTRAYGQSWTLNKVVSNQTGFALDDRINDTFTFRSDYNFSNMWWNDQTLKSTLTDNAGDYSETFRFFGPEHYYTKTGSAMLDARFATGSLEHVLSLGYWGSNEQDDDAASSSQNLGSSNLGGPLRAARPAIDTPDGPVSHIEWYYNSMLIGDRITLGPAWSALVGANETFVHELYEDTTTDTVTERFDAAKWSPSFALTYHPTPVVSTYVSYMQGLEFGDQAPDTAANANQILAPSASGQYELGLKATPGDLSIAVALFRIDKVNAELDPADNVYKQDGREVHQGLEVTTTGKVAPRLTLVGGFTWLKATVDKATADPALDGKTPLGVPELVARLYLEYQLAGRKDLVLEGGANYVGKAPTDNYDTHYLGDDATFDAGLRFAPRLWDHQAQVSLKVDNLFDKAYWASYTSRNGLQFGEPRTLALSLKYSL